MTVTTLGIRSTLPMDSKKENPPEATQPKSPTKTDAPQTNKLRTRNGNKNLKKGAQNITREKDCIRISDGCKTKRKQV